MIINMILADSLILATSSSLLGVVYVCLDMRVPYVCGTGEEADIHRDKIFNTLISFGILIPLLIIFFVDKNIYDVEMYRRMFDYPNSTVVSKEYCPAHYDNSLENYVSESYELKLCDRNGNIIDIEVVRNRYEEIKIGDQYGN